MTFLGEELVTSRATHSSEVLHVQKELQLVAAASLDQMVSLGMDYQQSVAQS